MNNRTTKNELDVITKNFRKKLYESVKPETIVEGQMSKYNSREAEKYFRQLDNDLVLVQDIKRWLTETANADGVDAADDLLKQIKAEINKISKNDY